MNIKDIKKEEYIRKIIKEETEQYLSELGLCHSKTTGFFDKCSAGNTYSLSDKGAKSAGLDSKWIKRGTLTKSKPRGSVPVTRASFGLNSQNKSGGRIKMTSGETISPRLSVSKYPKPYKEGLAEASLAMALWVASQDGSSDNDNLIDESSDCNCQKESRAAYQRGLNASLAFIQHYEQSKKGE
jgi:hypothetical protein